MKVLVAMDSFKGCLGSREAGEAVRDGVMAACPKAAVTLLEGGTLENNLIIADSVWIDASNVADYE